MTGTEEGLSFSVMDDVNPYTDRFLTLQGRVCAACRRSGRSPDDVKLIAVSKTVAAPAVQLAYASGQRRFGENRVQELCGKAGQLPADCEWHLIGHLQGNKVRAAVQAAAWIHAVDSTGLVTRLDEIAGVEHRRPIILLQVNVSGEATKGGVSGEQMVPLLEAALAAPRLDCRGLMTMAPYEASESDLRRIFGGLRELRDRLVTAYGHPLPELSMGMSGDFEVAVEEGATLVRVGTAIFGERSYPA